MPTEDTLIIPVNWHPHLVSMSFTHDDLAAMRTDRQREYGPVLAGCLADVAEEPGIRPRLRLMAEESVIETWLRTVPR